MNLKTERAINEAVVKTNASKWNQTKKWGRKALFATVSTISMAVGMLGTTQQMYAQNPQVIEVSVNDLDAYLNGGRNSGAQVKQQQYAQVYANRDAYRRSRQQGVVVNGEYAYENGNEYVWSYEFNDNLGRTLNDRAILGIYENCNGDNDYIMLTAPMDRYGRVIPDGRITAVHHTYEYLRDAKQQGHSGFRKSRNHNGGYYNGRPQRGHRRGRVSDAVRTVENIIDFVQYVGR